MHFTIFALLKTFICLYYTFAVLQAARYQSCSVIRVEKALVLNRRRDEAGISQHMVPFQIGSTALKAIACFNVSLWRRSTKPQASVWTTQNRLFLKPSAAFNIKTSQVFELLFCFGRFIQRARRFLGRLGAFEETGHVITSALRRLLFLLFTHSLCCVICSLSGYAVRGSAVGSGSAACVVLKQIWQSATPEHH